MIDLDLMFNKDFECEYNNRELIINNEENDEEIEYFLKELMIFIDSQMKWSKGAYYVRYSRI